jgi:hypothetical protein
MLVTHIQKELFFVQAASSAACEDWKRYCDSCVKLQRTLATQTWRISSVRELR